METNPPDLSRLRIDRTAADRPAPGRGPLILVLAAAVRTRPPFGREV